MREGLSSEILTYHVDIKIWDHLNFETPYKALFERKKCLMKTTKIAVLMATLLMLILAMVAYAQEPGDGKKKVNIGAQDIGGLGLNGSPPADYSVLYMFTGVINHTGVNRATAVHCTNFSADAVDVRVEAWTRIPGTTYSNTLTIDAGQTGTFATKYTYSFPSDVILAPPPGGIYQGSGRVLTKQHSNVICTAQVLDPFNDPPVFSSNLDMYRP